MRTLSVLFGLALLSGATAQERQANGVIHGVVITSEGQIASQLGMTAMPLDVPLSTALPHTRTNARGEYRFEKLPWWGKYIVYADDEEAGYSSYSTGPTGPAENSQPPQVEVTAFKPEAELNLRLAPKAGCIRIHLTSRKTGDVIPAMTIAIAPLENPDARKFADPRVFTMSGESNHLILVPPNENLLLHVKAGGFREWDESIGRGKAINLASGSVLTLQVQLDPMEAPQTGIANNVAYMHPGDKLGVNVGMIGEAGGRTLVNITEESNLENANLVLTFSQETGMMLLKIENRTEHWLVYEAGVRLPKRAGLYKTSVVPVGPHLTNFESWPYPIDQLALRNFGFTEDPLGRHDKK